MSNTTKEENTRDLMVSQMAENLIGSEIIKLAGDVNERIKNGEQVYNFTIGDFNSTLFPIPDELKTEIINAYQNNITNYPPANGVLELRNSVSAYLSKYLTLTYAANDILIAGGARPLIYATYQAIIDPNDTVVFPVPSWNNNHYTHLSRGKQVFIETKAENNFMPTASDFADSIKEATLIALCSPLNPTGTVFSKKQLSSICKMVIQENERRSENEKPLYIIYDQIYWQLTHGETEHFNPVSLFPKMRDYTIFIDGISKAYAATGVRVGWAFGPTKIIGKMKSILGHVGAWAPKAEQVATAKFLDNNTASDRYLAWIKPEIFNRLNTFYKGMMTLRSEGYSIDATAPQAAIYLTVRFDLKSMIMANGDTLKTTKDITAYLLNEAQLALVPFYAFGSSSESTWYRLSVGNSSKIDIDASVNKLRMALSKLK
ncbi:MAG: aminotransferase class I/II-fold pyridoxal phosphate-dependent enzyme [Flavobacteriales bacterium]|nr:aminotransferase class I/II-fold pyridoxal phosphate-dependent enzyme [Flavobacteriales bacterium]